MIHMRQAMTFSGIQQMNIRRYSRWVLVLFVVSWVNLIVQAPVHAAMKQQATMNSHMDMTHCHECPDTLCDRVLNLQKISTDVIYPMLEDVPDYQLAFVLFSSVPHKPIVSRLYIQHLNFMFESGRSPPLDITRILQI